MVVMVPEALALTIQPRHDPRASGPLTTPEPIPIAWIVPLRFSNRTMLKEPVNVPPPTTVPVNGTMSFAEDDFEPLSSFDFESSALATDKGPIAVAKITTLSRVDRTLMLSFAYHGPS